MHRMVNSISQHKVFHMADEKYMAIKNHGKTDYGAFCHFIIILSLNLLIVCSL